MKKILISIILLSICYSSSDEGLSNAYPLRGSEYSLGISDKVGFFGFSSHSWVTRQESFETYITMGTSMIILGSIGYGQKHYLIRPKGRFFSPYYSFTGFLYYLLPISENGVRKVRKVKQIKLPIVEHVPTSDDISFKLFLASQLPYNA